MICCFDAVLHGNSQLGVPSYQSRDRSFHQVLHDLPLAQLRRDLQRSQCGRVQIRGLTTHAVLFKIHVQRKLSTLLRRDAHHLVGQVVRDLTGRAGRVRADLAREFHLVVRQLVQQKPHFFGRQTEPYLVVAVEASC